MKNTIYFFYILILFSFRPLLAQQLPKDSITHKISYTDIVIADTLSAPQLYKNAEKWMNSNYKTNENYKSQFNLLEGFISFKTSYLVYTLGIMSKQVHGSISYNVTIDIKQNKYRYTFTDFVFDYYKQNRQYQYVSTGRLKPLEDVKYLGSQTVWNKHRLNTSLIITQQIEILKNEMKIKVENSPVKAEKEVKKTEW